ncbi:hypothetical protein AX16_002698 [Volvariella volvacea WC 439]|nr:hypothetical protein AX16_002698 [Volvariella volvacea WC 439]
MLVACQTAQWDPDRHPDDRGHATRYLNEVAKAGHTLQRHSKPPQPHSTPVHKRTDSSTTSDSELSRSTSTLGSGVRLCSSKNTSSSTAPTTPSHATPHPPHPWKPPAPKAQEERGDERARVKRSNSTRHERAAPQWDVPPRYSIPQMPRKLTKKSVPREVLTDYVPGKHEPRTAFGASGDHGTPLTAYGPPLVALGMNESREWNYALTLTLEELFKGKVCHFRITRHLLSGKTKTVILDVNIPQGCRDGTKILCKGVGHERRDGTLQDIAFIVKEASHDRFLRIDDDLYVDVRLPYIESFRRERGRVHIEGLSDEKWWIEINYPKTKSWQGLYPIEGAGMPIRKDSKVVGRGRLVVRWEMAAPEPTPSFPFFRNFKFFRTS